MEQTDTNRANIDLRIVYEGRMNVSYGQAYLEPADPEEQVDHGAAFAGQVNGLLGAAEPGALYLTTGLHTGDVGFRLVLGDRPPPLSAEWEDVVEVPFMPLGTCAVVQWGGDMLCEFDLPPVSHRVRYSARGMDQAADTDVVMDDEPLVDHYELVFWQADPTPEQIVRQGSSSAAHWHDARHFEKARARDIRAWWGENPPSERLIDVPEARWLVAHRRDLAEALSVAEPGAQRAVAFWAARRSCEQADIDREHDVADALATQDRGEILPPGFSALPTVQQACELTERAEIDEMVGYSGEQQPVPGRSWAVRAVRSADHENPLLAVLEAVTAGARTFPSEVAFLDEASRRLVTAIGGPDPRHDPWHGDFVARHLWGDSPPHRRLVEVFAHGLTNFDRELAERLAAATPGRQREVARWSARRACTAAGLAEALPQVALALDHLDRGEPLPAPFDQDGGEWELLDDGKVSEISIRLDWVDAEEEDEEQSRTGLADQGEVPPGNVPADQALEATITVDGQSNWSRAHFTLGVIRAAADEDPLKAAAHALWTAACSVGDEYRRALLAEASLRFLGGE